MQIRQIISIIGGIFLLLCISCGSKTESPEEVANGFITALMNQDLEGMKSFTTEASYDVVSLMHSNYSEADDSEKVARYKVVNVAVYDKDVAEVTIAIEIEDGDLEMGLDMIKQNKRWLIDMSQW